MPVCFTLSVLDQADNLRRLVLDDDGFIVSSFALHAQLRWSGFLVRFQVTVFHPRFTRLIVSRTSGGSASPLHQRGRNLTCTKPKFSKLSSPPFLSWSPSSILFSSFLGNGSHRLTQARQGPPRRQRSRIAIVPRVDFADLRRLQSCHASPVFVSPTSRIASRTIPPYVGRKRGIWIKLSS
jgi:hypothetical protein